MHSFTVAVARGHAGLGMPRAYVRPDVLGIARLSFRKVSWPRCPPKLEHSIICCVPVLGVGLEHSILCCVPLRPRAEQHIVLCSGVKPPDRNTS